jgi:phosphatidylglycerophosphatase A
MRLAIAGSFLLGIIFVGGAEILILKLWGKQKNHRGEEVDRDFNITTIDEVHGLLIGILLAYYFELSFIQFVIVQIVAFAAFRFFDVKKYWIIKKIEEKQKTMPRIFSPFTIMLDDTVAGIYTMPVTLVSCVVVKYWSTIAMMF